ncbi:MAG: hypothetical protein SAJ12_16350 [Jaaginema sp. PMC 1079.18]|nr:hypothetical protein [Jaaginema sp. PMC 1080.18]MEC4852556.1 hypothetical protein [Jaaginema sp. PMC 1079.18]MEC4867164.1 hypothetical protein [Jaaginema sp. PMC 1078.18]
MNNQQSQFYQEIVQRYAPVLVALLHYRASTDCCFQQYRVTWNAESGQLQLFDNNQLKLAASYDRPSHTYKAISAIAQLTAIDLENLEALANQLQQEGLVIGQKWAG